MGTMNMGGAMPKPDGEATGKKIEAAFSFDVSPALKPILEEYQRKLLDEFRTLVREEFKLRPQGLSRGYSTTEAAEILGCCTNTIRTLVNKGELKAFRVGSEIRISEFELSRYIALHPVQPTKRRRSNGK